MDDPQLPGGLTPEAQRERERFLERYQANLARIGRQALSILVWGPTPESTSPVAAKRREIRDRLVGEGHHAFFSEEIADGRGSLVQRELAQAQAADLVVVLYGDSPGAIAETHDFCTRPDIAPRVLVMIPRRFRTSYAGRGAIRDLEMAYRSVFWYTDEQLHACRVRTQAMKRATALRRLKALRGEAP